jgi:DNA-binding FrmR family transcriptional regulator
MKSEFLSGKLVLQRTAEEAKPLVQRLSRIEGQVRGLRQMIEDNRYCGDQVQQASAVIAAVREVALLLISEQMSAYLARFQDGASTVAAEPNMAEFIGLIRSSQRLQ